MPLRIGFDMDGVIADFRSAYREVEVRLYPQDAAAGAERGKRRRGKHAKGEGEGAGPGTTLGAVEDPAVREEAETAAKPEPSQDEVAVVAPNPDRSRRKRDAIWRDIEATPDFWLTLKPTEEGVVARIHDLMLRHRWEVFFITQRPMTAGDTVQRQTQKWLVEQGFDLPSVLVLGGSRGAAAGALRLDYHVDDSPQNCLDVISDSKARPLLIVPDDDEVTIASARKLRIGVAKSIGQALDILEEASAAKSQPGLLERLAAMVGWR